MTTTMQSMARLSQQHQPAQDRLDTARLFKRPACSSDSISTQWRWDGPSHFPADAAGVRSLKRSRTGYILSKAPCTCSRVLPLVRTTLPL